VHRSSSRSGTHRAVRQTLDLTLVGVYIEAHAKVRVGRNAVNRQRLASNRLQMMNNRRQLTIDNDTGFGAVNAWLCRSKASLRCRLGMKPDLTAVLTFKAA
jgi:hypothetical protein